MRILQILPALDETAGGGTTVAALAQCRELSRRGHDIEILARWEHAQSPPATVNGLRLHTVHGPMINTRLRRWARANLDRFDLLHVHLGTPHEETISAQMATLAHRALVPYVTQTHGQYRRGAASSGRTDRADGSVFALRHAAWRLVADAAERQVVAQIAGTDEHLSLIQDGIELPSIPAKATDVLDRDVITGAARTGVDVLAVSAVSSGKHVLDFADAAVAALELGVEATFTIVGPDRGDGAQLSRLIAANDHLDGLLRYLGPRPHEQVLARIAQADIVVIPACDGERSITLMEALAAGATVVCTDAIRHSLTVRARDAAVVVRPRSAALARVLVRLIDDAGLRKQFADQARGAAEELFDVRVTVDVLERDYKRALLRLCTPTRAEMSSKAILPAPRSAPEVPTNLLPSLDGVDRLLWVSDDVSEYRLNIWRQLATTCNLTVAVLASNGPNARLLGVSSSEPFRVVPLRAAAAPGPLGLTVHDAPRALRSLIKARPDAMVLDTIPSPAAVAALSWARRHTVPVVSSGLSSSPTPMSSMAGGPLGSMPRQAKNATPVAVDHLSTPRRHVDLRDGHRFLFMGELVQRSNVQSLLRAFALAADPGDELMISGFGPLRGELESLAEELHIDRQVTFTGPLPQNRRDEAVQRAHTVVLPFLDDVWSQEFFTAQAANRHIVATTACVAAVARARDLGVFVSAAGDEELARALMASRTAWRRRGRQRSVAGSRTPWLVPSKN